MVRGLKRRRSLRLRGYDYSKPGAYFVTICTRNRLPIFGRVDQGRMLLNNCGKIATSKWERLHERFPEIEIDEFIVMPDHIHGIIVIPDPAGVVGANHAGANSVGANHAGAIHELPRRRMTLPMVIGFYIRGFNPTARLDDKSASVYEKPAQDLLEFFYPRITGN